MKQIKYLIHTYSVLLIAIVYNNFSLLQFHNLLILFLFNLIAALAGIIISFNPNKYFHPNFKPIKTSEFLICQNKITDCQSPRGQLKNQHGQPLMNDSSRSDGQAETTDSKLDKTFDEIIQLVVRDFLLFSINDLLWDKDTMNTLANNELKSIVNGFRKAFAKFDYVKFISNDCVHILHQHFTNIQKASRSNEAFKLNSYEFDTRKELDYLRIFIDSILLNIFNDDDKAYLKNNAIRSLLREIILNKALLPSINMICDPHTLNEHLWTYLTTKESNEKKRSKIYSYAANYEDFIGLIKTCTNSDDLKEMKYRVINEIMHTTRLMNIKPKSSKDLAATSATETDKISKADLLMSRDLNKYMNQLKYAKKLCDRRMKGFDNGSMDDDNLDETLVEREVIPFDQIINSIEGRQNFMKLLETDGSNDLLHFWIDVNRLKRLGQNSTQQYELANRIYKNYIQKYDSPVRDEFSKNLCKQMKLSLIGSISLNVFLTAQKRIYQVLENDYYPSFVVTDFYQNLRSLQKLNYEKNDEYGKKSLHNFKDVHVDMMTNSKVQKKMNDESSVHTDFWSTSHLIKRIETLKTRLDMKLSALNALKLNESLVEDSKVIETVENNIKELQQQIGILEYHVEKTEIWCENIGNWKTSIISVDMSISNHVDADPVPHFVIQVKLFDNKQADNNTDGWIIVRTLKQFEKLHEHLVEMIPEISDKLKKMPNMSRSLLSKTFDENKIKKTKDTLDEYLKFITNHEILSSSQDLYTFLCPSPEYVKGNTLKIDNAMRSTGNTDQNSSNQSNTEKFSVSSLFGGYLSKEKDDIDDFFLDLDGPMMDSKDSIAEPIYVLIEDLFDLKGIKWFRKSLIAFVQFTYDGTINRKIREAIYSLLNEEMLTVYLRQLRDGFWSFNKTSQQYELIQTNVESMHSKADEDKIKLRNSVKLKLIDNIPEGLVKLIGEKNSKKGIIKVFEALQDSRLNKHLFYTFLEVFLQELCPQMFE